MIMTDMLARLTITTALLDRERPNSQPLKRLTQCDELN